MANGSFGAGSLPSRERGLKWYDRTAGAGKCKVAPFTGAWIEMCSRERLCWNCRRSLPSRERGLKCTVDYASGWMNHVAPFTGAWIEMVCLDVDAAYAGVAPFTGAWIEITFFQGSIIPQPSLPSRERGLKCPTSPRRSALSMSLPSRERGLKYAENNLVHLPHRRSLHGSVD